ncbi:phenylacetate-CoA oxygenase/reductase subunit PaaK [Leptobacterium flavescens]|uniref:Phenylacetate-CoA oxygenase/reductase subunit PaaK n=1 Tax=Leptobacterium flavescens TaxID=472055 RepID=A0A6P0UWT6_9FLAO|nr:1,2-phenylacetyl-CoA epoxidase subunit PaaE [Leptobacterium flavescens]NER14906.1 phenylacetate-CoA oxygenase/reductase subunit PaaK [Leptobacterium flavescens]
MSKFHKIKLSEVYKETADCSVLTFDIPEDLKDEFKFTQGQYLTLKTDIEGEEVRRSYSLCSSPVEDEWKVAVKKIPGGLFSTFANEVLKTGDELEVMEPNGSFFTEVNGKKAKNYIVFAAGSGITPILSILKTHLALEPDSTFKLFYLNRTAKSIIFKEEIEGLRNKYFGRFEIFYFLTKEHRDIPLLNGRFTQEKLNELTSRIINVNNVDECFICGPEEMIFLIRDELQQAGLDKEKIHFELFSSGNTKQDKNRIAKVLEHRAENTEVTIIDGGKEFHFPMEDHYDNILDGALAAGADLPYACKGGVCSTCKCKIVEGTVEMKINYALEKEEVESGFALSCQSVPTSKKVVVDFDV